MQLQSALLLSPQDTLSGSLSAAVGVTDATPTPGAELFSTLLTAQTARIDAEFGEAAGALELSADVAAFAAQADSQLMAILPLPVPLPSSAALLPTDFHSGAPATGETPEPASGNGLPVLAGFPAAALPSVGAVHTQVAQLATQSVPQMQTDATFASHSGAAIVPALPAKAAANDTPLAAATITVQMAAQPQALASNAAPGGATASGTALAVPTLTNLASDAALSSEVPQSAPSALPVITAPLVTQSPKANATTNVRTLEGSAAPQGLPLAESATMANTIAGQDADHGTGQGASRNNGRDSSRDNGQAPRPVKSAPVADILPSPSARADPAVNPASAIAPFTMAVPTHDAAPRLAPAASTAEPMQDLTQIVERLTAAREAMLPASAALAIKHADFGSLSLHFQQSAEGRITAELAAPDAKTHQAIAHALATEKSATSGQDSPARQSSSDSHTNSAARDNAHSRPQDQPAGQERPDGAARSASAANASLRTGPETDAATTGAATLDHHRSHTGVFA